LKDQSIGNCIEKEEQSTTVTEWIDDIIDWYKALATRAELMCARQTELNN